MSKKSILNSKNKICMVVQNPMVKGGIAAVVNGYRGSQLEKDFNVIYVESYKDGSRLSKILKAIGGYFHFVKVLLIDMPDIIHMHTSFGPSFYRSLPFIWMASWVKKPIINHCHGAEFENFYITASEKKKRLIRKAYGKCRVMIALSDEWKENLSKIVPVENIAVIENYSIMHDDAVKERVNRESNKQVLFLGTIGKRKGCYDIPAVAEKVAREIPNVKFVIAGDGDIPQIKALLKEKKTVKNVIFPGWVRDLKKDKLLRQSDIFFLPSYNEGMPMSILDAMGYALPIVSTDVGGITKIVRDGENGYTCQPGQIDSFVSKIVDLLKSEDDLKKMGIKSYNIVKEKYSLEYHLKLLSLLYNKVMYKSIGK